MEAKFRKEKTGHFKRVRSFQNLDVVLTPWLDTWQEGYSNRRKMQILLTEGVKESLYTHCNFSCIPYARFTDS
jgi:hypothetical protein